MDICYLHVSQTGCDMNVPQAYEKTCIYESTFIFL